jgi:hypothetical protein
MQQIKSAHLDLLLHTLHLEYNNRSGKASTSNCCATMNASQNHSPPTVISRTSNIREACCLSVTTKWTKIHVKLPHQKNKKSLNGCAPKQREYNRERVPTWICCFTHFTWSIDNRSGKASTSNCCANGLELTCPEHEIFTWVAELFTESWDAFSKNCKCVWDSHL